MEATQILVYSRQSSRIGSSPWVLRWYPVCNWLKATFGGRLWRRTRSWNSQLIIAYFSSTSRSCRGVLGFGSFRVLFGKTRFRILGKTGAVRERYFVSREPFCEPTKLLLCFWEHGTAVREQKVRKHSFWKNQFLLEKKILQSTRRKEIVWSKIKYFSSTFQIVALKIQTRFGKKLLVPLFQFRLPLVQPNPILQQGF